MQKRHSVLLLQCLVFACAALEAYSQGSVFYVSPSGLDTSPGDEALPFQTIAKAVNVAVDGDQIILLGPTHVVDAPVLVTKSISIVGSGSLPTISPSESTLDAPFVFSATNLAGVSFSGFKTKATAMTAAPSVFYSSNATISLKDLEIYCNTGIVDSCYSFMLYASVPHLENIYVQGGAGGYIHAVPSVPSQPWSNLTFVDGISSTSGALVLEDFPAGSAIEIENCFFYNNTADIAAAMMFKNVTAIVKQVECLDNIAVTEGGCLVSGSGSIITIANSRFLRNQALAGEGGALSLYPGSLVLSDSIFENNTATVYGGAISTAGEMSIANCTFIRNSAGRRGGAVYSWDRNVTVDVSTFHENMLLCDPVSDDPSFVYMGAAIGATYDTPNFLLNISNSVFTDNHANSSKETRGAVSAWDREVTITNCSFSGNTGFRGGALTVLNTDAGVKLIDVRFDGNSAVSGAGARLTTGGQIEVSHCVFESNHVTTSDMVVVDTDSIFGAGLVVMGATQVSVRSATFKSNRCFVPGTLVSVFGCSFYLEDSTTFSVLQLEDTVFISNEIIGGDAARGAGLGLISSDNLYVTIRNCKFLENRISGDGLNTNSYGAGIVTEGTELTTQLVIRMSDTVFSNNSANNGVIMLDDCSFELKNVTVKDNIGLDILGGVWVNQSPDRRAIDGTFVDCTFDGNEARSLLRDSKSTALHSISFDSVRGNAPVKVIFKGSNQFLNLKTSFDMFFGAEIEILDNVEVSFEPEYLGAQTELPPLLMIGSSVLDLTNITSKIPCIKIWWTNEHTDPSLVRIGEYDATVDGEATFHCARVRGHDVASQSGKLVLRGQTWIVGDDTYKEFQNIVVLNTGSVSHYDSILYLSNATITNSIGAFWDFPMYNPEARIYGPGRFENNGSLSASTGYFPNVTVVFNDSSKVNYLLTNFWEPSFMRMPHTGSLVLAGSISLNSNPMREFSEPNYNQEFMIAMAEQGIFGTVSLSNSGGYNYTMKRNATHLSALVESFYPIRVTLGNDGSYILVTFPRATNAPAGGDCSVFLVASTINSLSTSAKCVWTSSSQLRIQSVKSGPTIQFKEGVITDAVDSRFVVHAVEHSVQAPESPVSPVTVLIAPDVHPTCADLILNAKASYNLGDSSRAVFRWTLKNYASAADDAIVAHLNLLPQNASIVHVPAGLLSQRNYLFGLNLTNSLGQSAQAETSVQVEIQIRPIVFREGPLNRSIASAFDTQLNARVEIPDCGAQILGTRLDRSWSLVQSTHPLSCVLKNPTEFSLFIPALCMAPEATYTFKFSVWPVGNPALTSSQEFTIRTLLSSLSLFSTGDGGLIDSTKPIQLQVALVDPDSADNSAATYTWKVLACPGRGSLGFVSSAALAAVYLGRSSVAAQINSTRPSSPASVAPISLVGEDIICVRPDTGEQFTIPTPTTSTLSIAANTLPAGEYLFAVSALKNGRYASDIIYLQATSPSSSLHKVAIRTRQSSLKVLPQEKLVLKGLIDGVNAVPAGLSVLWSDESSSSALILNSINLLTPNSSVNMVVKPDILVPGQFYSVKLEASSGATIVGSSRAIIAANTAPGHGSLYMDPLQVRQFDRATFEAPGWVDADAPLNYVFSIVDATSEIILSEQLEIPTISFVMPLAGALTGRVRVVDAGGAITMFEIPISVLSTDSSAIDQLRHDFNRSVDMGDFRAANQQLMALLVDANSRLDAALPLREELGSALLNVVGSRGVTSYNVALLVKSLALLTGVPSGISDTVASITISLLEQAVDAARASESVASRLSSSTSSLARASALEFVRAAVNIVNQLKASSIQSKMSSNRILVVFTKILELQAKYLVMDEFAAVLGTDSNINMTAVISNQTIYIGGQNTTVIVGAAGKPLSARVITWVNGTFPGANPQGNGAPTVVTVISETSGVDVVFSRNRNDQPSCVTFDEASGGWDSSKCAVVSQSTSDIKCRCQTGGSRTSISLLFGGSEQAPTAESNTGIVAGVTVFVVIFVAAGIAGGVWYYKKRQSHESKSVMMHKLNAAMQSDAPPASAAQAPPPAARDNPQEWRKSVIPTTEQNEIRSGGGSEAESDQSSS